MNPNEKPQARPDTFVITSQQLQVLGNFLAKLPWEQANPHIQMLNSLRPINVQPAPQPAEQETAS